MKIKLLFLIFVLAGCFCSVNELSCALNPDQKAEVDTFIATVKGSIDYLSQRLEAARKIALTEIAGKFEVDMDITAGAAAAPIGAGFDEQLTALQDVLAGNFSKFAAVKQFFTGKGLFAEEE